MTKPQTLNELGDLKEVGFGKPSPRHGLKLLHWFANNCLYFDNNNQMCWRYNPQKGHFGLKFFGNKTGLLPYSNLKYYEMGNLREAEDLPDYVRDDYIQNRNDCDSNKDRIIVSVNDKWLDRVYVTQHNDGKNDFNKNATYFISKGLIMNITNRSLEDFLSKTGYLTEQEIPVQNNEHTTVDMDYEQNTGNERVTEDDSQWENRKSKSPCSCTIL
ncbi:uncharacterized protein LOC124395799 [Silurus meridionalis]|uniref:uncharacterized protein LOC124395799 n=1 Tax=Silurus meridionalis TaxID=175797 RepID=UPI001EEBF09F|nr:uncharacterized protein LOC124395799 [Silurus meridionalis]XP_046720610.1 uncharacterized protein LOC124395799 [Silurus meridionalis]KAI5107662.1 hypothetical protein C0J45_1256 [Silurus meridionalis]